MAAEGAWWPVAMTDAVDDRPYVFRLHSIDYVLFRDAAGTAHALLDQCAHRRAPLSLGRVTRDGLLECPYHGWRYDGTGACRQIPNLSADERVPKRYAVPTLPICEQDGLVWTSLKGDGAPAPLDDPFVNRTRGQLDVAFPHGALIDLLLDAPQAVLRPKSLVIVPDHRFGDPVVSDDGVSVVYAMRKPGGDPDPGDFPFLLHIAARRDGTTASCALRSLDGRHVASLHLGLSPASAMLTSIFWVAGGNAARAMRPIPAIDPGLVRRARPNVSPVRGLRAAEPSVEA